MRHLLEIRHLEIYVIMINISETFCSLTSWPSGFDFDEMCLIYYLACSFFRCLQHLNFCCFSLRYFFKSTIIFFLCCVHWILLDLVICFSFFVWSCSIYHETVSVAIEQNHTLSLLLSKTEQYSACSPCQWMIIDIAPEGWHPMSFLILGKKSNLDI